MKRFTKKAAAVLAGSLSLTMLLGTSVFAEGAQTSRLDFYHQYMTVKAGESGKNYIYATEPVKAFKLHSTSSKTAIVYQYEGNINATVYIGEDETSDQVQFAFYPLEGVDYIDSMWVNVVHPAAGTQLTAVAPTAAPVALADGTIGSASTQNESQVVLVSNSIGNCLGAFAVTANGALTQVQVTGANGGFIAVTAPNAGSGTLALSISAEDAASLKAAGFAGVNVNGTVISF